MGLLALNVPVTMPVYAVVKDLAAKKDNSG